MRPCRLFLQCLCQYNDIPCGHAIAVMQTYQVPAGGQRRSARDFIPYNLTLEAFKATYVEPMLPVEVEGLGARATMTAERPSSKKRAAVLRLLALQQVGREAGRLHGMGFYKISLTWSSTALAVVFFLIQLLISRYMGPIGPC